GRAAAAGPAPSARCATAACGSSAHTPSSRQNVLPVPADSPHRARRPAESGTANHPKRLVPSPWCRGETRHQQTTYHSVAGVYLLWNRSSVGEAFRDFSAGKADLLKRSLVQQVAPPDLLQGTTEALASKDGESIRAALAQYP